MTITGEFHIDLLRLNRPALVAHRRAKLVYALLQQKCDLLEIHAQQLKSLLEAQEKYISFLRTQISDSE